MCLAETVTMIVGYLLVSLLWQMLGLPQEPWAFWAKVFLTALLVSIFGVFRTQLAPGVQSLAEDQEKAAE